MSDNNSVIKPAAIVAGSAALGVAAGTVADFAENVQVRAAKTVNNGVSTFLLPSGYLSREFQIAKGPWYRKAFDWTKAFFKHARLSEGAKRYDILFLTGLLTTLVVLGKKAFDEQKNRGEA